MGYLEHKARKAASTERVRDDVVVKKCKPLKFKAFKHAKLIPMVEKYGNNTPASLGIEEYSDSESATKIESKKQDANPHNLS